jgi:uncharacterized membrane protein YfcA
LATIIGIGLLAGFFIGSAGVGGVIVVPALTYFANIETKLAIATALMGFALSGIVGTIQYRLKGSIRWSSAGILSAAAAPATIVGAVVTHKMSPLLLNGFIGLAVLSAGAQINFFRDKDAVTHSDLLSAPRLATIGAVTGFGSVITGTGGPLLLVPILIWQQLSPLTAIGLAQVIQLPISLVATATNLITDTVDVKLGGVLAVALAVGCWFGASVTHRVSSTMLRLGLSYLLIGIGLVLVADVLLKFQL